MYQDFAPPLSTPKKKRLVNKIKDNKKYNFYSELNKLWIHGLVHLFGFKHYKITDYKKMNVLEKKILNHINK